MVPNFLVIGAMKAGTDSLYEYLQSHPQVFMSETKELHFFVAELNWKLGEAWYEHQFEQAGNAVAIGEASTTYSKYPLHQGVPSRISKLLPDVAVVYLVRHPIERLRSQYLHQALHGLERRPIEQAVLRDPSYLDFSRYALQIEQYLAYFSADRLLVLTSEDLRWKRLAAMESVFRFIGVDGNSKSEALAREFHQTAEKRVLRPFFRAIHRIPGHARLAGVIPDSVKEWTSRLRTRGIDPERATISDRLRARLEEELRDDVKRLRAYMGDGFDGWGIG